MLGWKLFRFLLFTIMIFFWSCENLTPEEKLKGVDKNNNGIRDDVDEYIAEVAQNNDERRALEIYSKYHRKVFDVYKDKIKSNENTIQLLRASSCVFNIMGYQKSKDVSGKIKKKYYHTKEQLNIYSTVNRHFSGQMSEAGLPAEKNCDFKLEKKYDD